jgi:DNA-binding NarL/FixJ family response regulator
MSDKPPNNSDNSILPDDSHTTIPPSKTGKTVIKQRILLVDDHEVVRLGLKALLERHPNFEVIAEASAAREAVEKVEELSPDVVVMDIRLPGGSGIEACEEISERFPNSRVIMLTSYAEDEMLFSAIRAGAAGYVLKQIGGEDLVRAIEAVGRGEAHATLGSYRIFQEVRKAARMKLLPSLPLPNKSAMFCYWYPKAKPIER